MLARLAAALLGQIEESIRADKSWLGLISLQRQRKKLASTLAFVRGTVGTLLHLTGFNAYKTSMKLVS